MHRTNLFFAALIAVLMACHGASSAPRDTRDPPPADTPPADTPSSPPPAERSETADNLPLVVFLGDSLTAGYGLDKDRAFPAVISSRLAAEGKAIRVVNAGVSGGTTAGGLNSLGWLLRQKPDVLVVSLGGNDGLRALDVSMTEQNLRRIVTEARAAGARVLLTGMLVPPNYGPDYAEQFQAVYPRLAAELDVPLVPFLLEGVAADPELNQSDGIHPTAEGQRRVAEVVLPYLNAILAELPSS